MAGDINRLFSVINQSDLPYRVFEEATSPAEAAPLREAAVAPMVAPMVAQVVVPREAPVIEPRLPANEDIASAHAGLFRAYNVEAVLSASQGRPLADIFRRMAKR